jgi:hypothetical protein
MSLVQVAEGLHAMKNLIIALCINATTAKKDLSLVNVLFAVHRIIISPKKL